MRRLLGRVPAAGWMCALAGLLNAAAWGLVTPLFHVPDEPQHIAYAQYFAETWRPPSDSARPAFSTEEKVSFELVRFDHVAGNERGRPPWNGPAVRSLNQQMNAGLRADDGGGLTNAASNPPMYYAVQAVPYWASSSGSFTDQVLFMRLLSAFLAALTVLFCFAFVRELMPSTPWAWTVGGLAVAFQPVFGFIGGGVTSDNLLFVASAATLYLLVRAFRRGVSARWGLAFGLVVAIGLITKGTMLGLLPAVVVGGVLLVLKSANGDRLNATRAVALAAALVALIGLGYLVISEAAWHRSLYPATEALSSGPQGEGRSVTRLIEYAWQFYLPRLPFMDDQWLGVYPIYDVWFSGLVGRFGWLDYGFPKWVNTLALMIAALVVGLALSTLIRLRSTLRTRWTELLTYVIAVVGLAGVIAVAGYGYRVDTGDVFEQTRYLFPLLPLYGAFIAVAARGAGRNGPVVGAGIVVIAVAHQLFSMLLTVSRYYA